MCKVLAVRASNCCALRKRLLSWHDRNDAVVLKKIRSTFTNSHNTEGLLLVSDRQPSRLANRTQFARTGLPAVQQNQKWTAGWALSTIRTGCF